jgi:hypothetical protein
LYFECPTIAKPQIVAGKPPSPWTETLKLIKIPQKILFWSFTFGQLFLPLPRERKEETADNYFL